MHTSVTRQDKTTKTTTNLLSAETKVTKRSEIKNNPTIFEENISCVDGGSEWKEIKMEGAQLEIH
jgi:hypothetical protein